jgi:hypothetical protein
LESRLGASLEENGFVVPDAESAESVEDESAPVGPSAEEESNYLAEQRFAPGRAGAAPPTEDDAVESGDLPGMDALVKRIPADVVAMMDELFRAKFVKVQRVPKRALKR